MQSKRPTSAAAARLSASKLLHKRKQARAHAAVVARDESIERFAIAAATMTTQLSAHAQRMDALDGMFTKVHDDIKDLRASQAKDNQFLHQRIDGVQRDLNERLDTQTKELTGHFDEGLKTVIESRSKTDDRVRDLELSKMAVVGGGAVIGVFIVDVIIRIFGDPVATMIAKLFGF